MNTTHMHGAAEMRATLRRAADHQIQRALELKTLTYAIDAQLAESVLEQFADEREAIAWLWAPNPELGGEPPLRLAALCGDKARVLRLLARLAGVPEDAVRVAS